MKNIEFKFTHVQAGHEIIETKSDNGALYIHDKNFNDDLTISNNQIVLRIKILIKTADELNCK